MVCASSGLLVSYSCKDDSVLVCSFMYYKGYGIILHTYVGELIALFIPY